MKMFFAAALMALSAVTAAHSASVVTGSFETIGVSPSYGGGAGMLTFTGATVASGMRSAGIGGASISVADSMGPVPEPAARAMMIDGFGMVGATMRRRRASLGLT